MSDQLKKLQLSRVEIMTKWISLFSLGGLFILSFIVTPKFSQTSNTVFLSFGVMLYLYVYVFFRKVYLWDFKLKKIQETNEEIYKQSYKLVRLLHCLQCMIFTLVYFLQGLSEHIVGFEFTCYKLKGIPVCNHPTPILLSGIFLISYIVISLSGSYKHQKMWERHEDRKRNIQKIIN